MATLRVTFDFAADAAYFSLRDIEPGGSAVQCAVECPEARGTIILDLDREGRLIGVEVVGAQDGLPRELLAQAERP